MIKRNMTYVFRGNTVYARLLFIPFTRNIPVGGGGMGQQRSLQ